MNHKQIEMNLAVIAENHHDDDYAAKAMRILRIYFDSTYFWCDDCDGLVCKEKECCINRIDSLNDFRSGAKRNIFIP